MNDIEVRFPGLLDAELNESERLCPLAASLTLNLYGSSEATITLPEDTPYIRIHDWVSLYTQNGFAGIFRVTNISRNFKRNLEITLLHGIDILSDSVWAEQDKFSGTMEEFLTKALNFQTHLVNGVKPWVLGTCEDNSTTFTDKEMNYDRLSTLLEGLIEEGGDYYYEYNMSTFPWTLNVRRKSSVVWSEFRLSRNVTTANVTYNDADLCTRLIVSVNNKTTEERGDYSVPSETVYPDQSAHGLIPDSSKAPGSTAEVTSNETTIRTYDSESGQRNWGIVVKTADIDLAEIRQTWPSVDAWAANFMGLRSQPSVQIQIDGEELAQLSGDNWDELALGRNCRVCLPTYSPGYFNERVVSVTYPDLFSRPSHVTVSLANTLPKFSESITRIADKADSAASSARSAGRYAASAEELTQWSQIVEYYGEALDGTGVMTLYRSGIEMDAAGGVKIYSLTQGAQSLYAGIQVTSSEIASEIRRAQEAESSIRQTADSIATRVSTAEGKVSTLEQTASSLTTRIGTAEGNISTLQQTADSLTSRIETAEGKYSLIEQTATKVGMVVVTQTAQDGTTSNKINVSGIVTAINNDNTTETVIQANKIVLNSNQTQISISDIFSASSTVKAPAVHTAALYADSITTAAYGSGTSPDTEGSTVTMGTHLLSMQRGTGNNSLSVQFLGNGDANLDHYHVLTISEITTGNDAGKMQVKLGNPTRNVADATQNFKIADTIAYKTGVSAARNSVEVGLITWTGPTASDNQSEAHGKRYSLSATIPLVYQTGVDGQGEPVYTTIRTYGPISQNITGVYDAGWDNGSDSVTLNDTGWSSTNQRTISTVGRHTEEQSVTVSVSGVWDTQESSGTDAEKATAVYRILSAPAGTTPTDGNTLFTTSPVMSFQTYTNANHVLTAQLKAGNKLLASVAYDTTDIINYGRSLVSIDPLSTWNGGTLLVQTTGRTDADGTVNQSTRTVTLSQGTESLSDAVFTVPVLDGNNTWTGFSVVVDASDLVTPAQVINVNKGQWVYNAETQDSTQITFSPSSGSGSAQTLTLTMGERTASWSTTHKKRIDVFDGFTQTSATRTGVSFLVDASDQYYLGKSTVGLSDTGWTNNGSRTIGTSGRTDASGTESNASRTIQISVPSSDFSITSSYDSQSEHVTITASAVAKDVANNGNITVATGTSTEVNKAISVSNITLGKSFSRSSAGGQPLSHSGSVSISRSGGGVVSFGTISTVTAEVTSCSVPITLQTPSASFNWDSINHVYTYTTSASVAVDGTNDALTRSVAGTLTPTDAINHGRTLVSLNDMTWNPVTGSSYPASQTISAKTSGRTNASGTAQEITKTLNVTPSLSFNGTNIYARLQVGSGSTTIAQVSGTISVTGASVTSSQVAYNKTNRTARGQVTGTISGTVNNTTFSKTFTLSDVNFDWAYQDGLDGNAYSERDYEFEDSSTGWSDEYPLNLREVYQKGVDDAEPVFEPVARYVWAESNNGAIKFYKNSTGSTRWGTLEYNTRVWLLDPDAVNDRYYVAYRDGYDNEWAGYIPTQYVHENRKDAYGGGGWVEEPAGSEKTMYIYAANGEPVSVYSSASTSSEIGKLYPNTEVTRVSTSGTWTQIRVTSGGRTVKGYLQNGSVSLRDTDNSPSHYSLTGWVSPPQTVTVTGILIQDVQHNSGIFSSPLNVKMADTRTTVMREFTSTATQSAAYEAITTSGDPSDYLELVNTTSGVKYYAWHNSSTNSGDVGHKVRLAVSYSNGNTETVWINIFSKASSTYQYIS